MMPRYFCRMNILEFCCPRAPYNDEQDQSNGLEDILVSTPSYLVNSHGRGLALGDMLSLLLQMELGPRNLESTLNFTLMIMKLCEFVREELFAR